MNLMKKDFQIRINVVQEDGQHTILRIWYLLHLNVYMNLIVDHLKKVLDMKILYFKMKLKNIGI